MMKFVFAFVALLHLCYSVTSTGNVYNEILSELEKLNVSYRRDSITLPDVMRVPSREMLLHPTSCVGVFVKELKQILNNVTVVGDSESSLTKLRANLDFLEPQVKKLQDDRVCNMTDRVGSLMPFKTYTKFLRNLNRAKKR